MSRRNTEYSVYAWMRFAPTLLLALAKRAGPFDRAEEHDMDGASFDTLVRRLSRGAARRTVLAGLAGVGLVGAAGFVPDEIAGKKRKKKTILCSGGQTITAGGKQRKKLIRAGATPGACPPTTLPACPDIRSTADLQLAIDAAAPGATLRLCPGTFRVTNTISIFEELTIVGAGAAETILDGENARLVLDIRHLQNEAPAVTVENLTITRGKSEEGVPGGGITNNTTLTLRSVIVTDCTAPGGAGITNIGGTLILENTAVRKCVTTGLGGGILNFGGTTILKRDSTVSDNIAATGGGIQLLGEGNGALNALTMEAGSVVSDNEAEQGGGIAAVAGTVTLEAGSSVTGNKAGPGATGGGIFSSSDSTIEVVQGTVVNNTPDNCEPNLETCG